MTFWAFYSFQVRFCLKGFSVSGRILGPTSLVPTSSLPSPQGKWKVGLFLFQQMIVAIDCKGLLHANKEVEMALVTLNEAWTI